MELPYSNAKLKATNNLIKVIRRNAFAFRNFENFRTRIHTSAVKRLLRCEYRFLERRQTYSYELNKLS